MQKICDGAARLEALTKSRFLETLNCVCWNCSQLSGYRDLKVKYIETKYSTCTLAHQHNTYQRKNLLILHSSTFTWISFWLGEKARGTILGDDSIFLSLVKKSLVPLSSCEWAIFQRLTRKLFKFYKNQKIRKFSNLKLQFSAFHAIGKAPEDTKYSNIDFIYNISMCE